MAVFSTVPISELNTLFRWDAEAYTPKLREADRTFKNAPKLRDIATVTHPSEILRVYFEGEKRKPFMRAQNIRAILPDMTNLVYLSDEALSGLPLNRLEQGDVLVTRSGANSGVACVYLGEGGEVYTSGEGLIVRTHGRIDGAYLAVFLSSSIGAALCRRAIYGSGQPHIGPKYLELTPVLRLGTLEDTVSSLVREAHVIIENAKLSYPEAEAEMLERMGWPKLAARPPELHYIQKFSEVNGAGRFDAEHFHPQYKRLRLQLGKAGACKLSEFCPPINRGVQPEFVEGGNVLVVDSKAVRRHGVEPSETERTDIEFYQSQYVAKGRVKFGDVLLNSTGRGTIGRASCYQLDVPAIADNHVAIIRPYQKVCLPIYLALFLNSPAGIAQSEMFQSGSSGQLELYPQHINQFLVYLPKNSNGRIDRHWQQQLVDKVISVGRAKVEAQSKLNEAKRIVEDAISNYRL